MTSTTRPPSALASLQPVGVWKLFSEIAAIPRPSKREDRVRAWILNFARLRGLSTREDRVGNVVVQVPASRGKEAVPVTVLQAHLDMVCEKNADVSHDFDQEGIRPIVEEDRRTRRTVVRADRTTLGADNGIGVAMALALASDTETVHGPLELLLTVDEEAGMTGAKGLSPELVTGRRMLNLDSEEDDSLYIGCAGGGDVVVRWSLSARPVGEEQTACRVLVRGLRGGHSGGDIHEGRGNAIKLLARVLHRVERRGLHVSSLEGGSLRNAIPREARATLVGDADLLDRLRVACAAVQAEATKESLESGASITVEPLPSTRDVVAATQAEGGRVLDALLALPNGVLGMHPTIKGLVETSNNLATLRTERAGNKLKIEACSLARSSSESRKQETIAQIAAVARLAGGSVETSNEYPGWSPNADSPLLGVCRRVYERLFSYAPTVAAIHAGLECGILQQRLPGMDVVSLGPTIVGAHSPDEHVFVDSVQKCWRYLRALLVELAAT